MTSRSGIYIVPTDTWYIERTVWLIAGVAILGATALAAWVHPLWVLGVVATAAASITVALSGFCIMATGLYWRGAEPWLAPGTPRQASLHAGSTA